MPDDTAISVEHLSKRCRIGLKEQTHDTFGGMLLSWLRSPLDNYRRLRRLAEFEGESRASRSGRPDRASDPTDGSSSIASSLSAAVPHSGFRAPHSAGGEPSGPDFSQTVAELATVRIPNWLRGIRDADWTCPAAPRDLGEVSRWVGMRALATSATDTLSPGVLRL